MNYLYGIVAALGLAWVTTKLGELVRDRLGGGLNKWVAMGIGVGSAMAIWYGLKYGTSLPKPIIDAVALGPAVGLTQGLSKPEPKK